MSISSLYPTIRPSLNLDFANVKALDPRITFTRTTTATYYGTETAKAEENLHIQSQEFDTAFWSKSSVTVTADQTTAPDGTSTAELMAETNNSAFHLIAGNAANNRPTVVSGQTYAFSVFLKKGTGATAPDVIQVTWAGAGFAFSAYANFNLDTGVISSSGAGALTSTITAAGNGWYRCSLTATATSTVASSLGIIFVENDGSATRAPSYLGVTTADVFLWGAQLEQRSAVTAYTPTTTQPITNYIPVLETAASGEARFDHNPLTGESLGLLVEEQRTNLLTYSEQFDNAAWTKVQATITANTIIAPNGTLTGDKLIVNNAETAGYAAQTISVTSGTSYTVTCYLKAGEQTDFRFVFESTGFGSNLNAIFNLSNGTVTSFTAASASIQSVGNGWYRCVATAAATSTASTGFQFRSVYTGDGYSGIYIWGAQLEAAAFPTSYIPTVAATVTRNADAASMTGTNFSSWYRADEGTIYSEGNVGGGGNSKAIATISAGANANRMILATGASNTVWNPFIITNSTGQVSFSFSGIAPQNNAKVSFAYKTDDTNAAVNGTTGTTDTSGTIPVVDRLFIGGNATGTDFSNGYIKKLSFYPARLSDAQLQALTTV